MALTKLPYATTSLHHHLLGHCHHNAEEVWILKCLQRGRTSIVVHWCADKCIYFFDFPQNVRWNDKCLTEAGRQKTDCSVTSRSVKSTSFLKSGKWSMSIPTWANVHTNKKAAAPTPPLNTKMCFGTYFYYNIAKKVIVYIYNMLTYLMIITLKICACVYIYIYNKTTQAVSTDHEVHGSWRHHRVQARDSGELIETNLWVGLRERNWISIILKTI